MSILSRHRANRHLSDDKFADIWSAAVADGEPVADPHLASCSQCQSRYAEFTDWLERIHDDARDGRGRGVSTGAARRPAGAGHAPSRGTRTAGSRHRVPALCQTRHLDPGPHATVGGRSGRSRSHDRSRSRPVLRHPARVHSDRGRRPPRRRRVSRRHSRRAVHRSFPCPVRRCPTRRCSLARIRRAPSERLSMLRSIDDITPRARDLERPR